MTAKKLILHRWHRDRGPNNIDTAEALPQRILCGSQVVVEVPTSGTDEACHELWTSHYNLSAFVRLSYYSLDAISTSGLPGVSTATHGFNNQDM